MIYVEDLINANTNASLYGGKGSNLITLINFGINIPPGFIVNTKAYTKFIESSYLNEKIFNLLSNIYEPKDILNLSVKIKDFFKKSRIPAEIVNDIKKAFKELQKKLGEDNSFSVRSSANIEDANNFSFAGQAKSYLNITSFSELLKSIKKCWLSLFNPNSLLYILQMKKNNEQILLINLKMAVVIQKMINSHVSGVLFTTNILNNDKNEILINSTWGLGETITNGSIIPDLIILNKERFSIIKNVVGEKEKTSICNPTGDSTVSIPTEQRLREQCSLNENQLIKLHNLGLKIEKYFNYPQDIEWAIENNIIYVLQSRPITTLRE